MVQVIILKLISLLLVAQQGGIAGFNITHQEQNEEEVVNWAAKNYEAVQGILLPLGGDDKLGENIEWRLIVLIHPPWDAESRIQITRRWNGKFFVTLSHPQGRSIYEWLKDIHRRNRDAALNEVIQQIVIQEQNTDTDQCPRLKPLIDQLNHIEFPIIPWSGLVMDPTNYQIRCQTQMNTVNLSLIDTDGGSFFKWIEELIAVLKSQCGQELEKKN